MIHAPVIFEPAVAMSELLTEAVAPLDSLPRCCTAMRSARCCSAEEVELLFDIITARHAVTLLVHAWRRRHDRQGARVLDEAAYTPSVR